LLIAAGMDRLRVTDYAEVIFHLRHSFRIADDSPRIHNCHYTTNLNTFGFLRYETRIHRNWRDYILDCHWPVFVCCHAALYPIVPTQHGNRQEACQSF
jgi:hypothetical protein